MARGSVYPSEARSYADAKTGARVRQVTDQPCIHHHPFFIVPAYDAAMARLVFVSHRSERPEIYAEDRASLRLVQLTQRADIAEYSLYPSRDGRWVYFTAGSGGYRVCTETQREEQLLDFGDLRLRERGMVADAMGTTALSLVAGHRRSFAGSPARFSRRARSSRAGSRAPIPADRRRGGPVAPGPGATDQ